MDYRFSKFPVKKIKKILKQNKINRSNFFSFMPTSYGPFKEYHNKLDDFRCQGDSYAIWMWLYGRMDHYFLSSGVKDFCISGVKDLDPEYFGELPRPPQTINEETRPLAANMFAPSVFALHFPVKERQRSIIVLDGAIFREIENGKLKLTNFEFMATDIEYSSIVSKQFKTLYPVDEKDDMLRVVLGFSLYVKCFPEMITSAKLNKIKNNYSKGRKMIVGRHQIVDEEARLSVSPHFRRGHFRYLSSDRYKNKKGETIFIKGCFVKGKAYDVLID